jgi:hypothetical protein
MLELNDRITLMSNHELEVEGDEYLEEEDSLVTGFEVTVIPNDFNISTITNYLERGVISIPPFQRNYVWDVKKASRLIESLLIGLPVPQIFLYEKIRNKFEVIDGQQRLLSLYFFSKGRFPRRDDRVYLRDVFNEHGGIPEKFLGDDSLFTNFNLQLPSSLPGERNPLHGYNVGTLPDQYDLGLKTIRAVVIRQTEPAGSHDAMYEIFNRLNSGGVNLRPQEIRASFYYSKFYDDLLEMNKNPIWRKVLNQDTPDLHFKDVEIILRVFALLIHGDGYSPSMIRFLNNFSESAKGFSGDYRGDLKLLWDRFMENLRLLPDRSFINPGSNRFMVGLFETVFYGACIDALERGSFTPKPVNIEVLERLTSNNEFMEATQRATASTVNVDLRLKSGKEAF